MKKLFFLLALASVALFTAVAGCGLLDSGICLALNPLYVYLGSASIHLALFSIAMFFLWKQDLRTTLASIGFPGTLRDALAYSAIGLSAIFMALFIVGIVSIAGGFNDQQKVSERVLDLPLVILAFAVLVAPVTEELFFRAFLSPRVGIVVSSILFALAHFTYGSIVEVVGVLFVGMLLASIYRMSRSITPCIVVHMAYNLLSIAVTLYLGGKA
jgi:membrane protease YdiL (CAAX protease family)